MIFSNKNTKDISPAAENTTVIGAGVTFTGDINSTADIKIDGSIKGNVSCTATVLLGAEGFVEGNVDCGQADVMGRIKGNVTAKDLLHLHGKAFLEGDIFAPRLQVEPPAIFNGQSHMNQDSVAPLIEMHNKLTDESSVFTTGS